MPFIILYFILSNKDGKDVMIPNGYPPCLFYLCKKKKGNSLLLLRFYSIYSLFR